jgi:8-oxo-dGTP pyrophosphatase MutT (NUDIX family)
MPVGVPAMIWIVEELAICGPQCSGRAGGNYEVFSGGRGVGREPPTAGGQAKTGTGSRNAFARGRRPFDKGRVFIASARALLSEYLPSELRERAFRERMLGMLDSATPTSRRQFAPGHLTASAFVLSPERDAVLLILHKKLGIWVQPGGHIESGDPSLEAAARREVNEEVGPSLVRADGDASIFDLDIHAIPARKDEPAHEHFDVRFCFTASSRNLVVSDEVTRAKWARLAEIETLTTDQSVLRAVRKLAQRGAGAGGK